MKFYDINTDFGRRKNFAYGITYNRDLMLRINCDKCGSKRYETFSDDESVKQTFMLTNNFFSDFMRTDLQRIILPRVNEIFTKEKISGYHICDNLEIITLDQIPEEKKKELRRRGYDVKRFSNEAPECYRFCVDGKAELHDKSEIITVSVCDKCSYVTRRTKDRPYVDPDHPLYITKSSWDGSDFFREKGSENRIFCTERVVEVFEKYKLTGLEFTEVEGL